MPLATNKIVDASTIHPPHARCGINSRMSTKKARSVIKRVGRSRMIKARRYRGECEGEWKCAETANMKQTRVRTAATGCTMRIEDKECRVLVGSVKLMPLSGVKSSQRVIFNCAYVLEADRRSLM